MSDAGYLSPRQLAEIAQCGGRIAPAGTNSIFRRDLIPEPEPYRPELGPFSDWFLGQVIVFRHGCCYIPESLAAFRWIEGSYLDATHKTPNQYRQFCTTMLQLLASPEYRDITPLLIRARSLRAAKPFARNPYVVFQTLRGIKTEESRALLHHLTMEYILVDLTNPLRKLVRTTCVRVFYYLKNLYDRAFARSFHEYDRVRHVVRKKLDEFFGKTE